MPIRRKVRKKDVDRQLVQAIFIVEREWKQLQSLRQRSISPLDTSVFLEKIAREKYLYLLSEARHRKVSAIRY